MLPKIIHYCWFGRGEKSELIKQCIESWRKFCPDYEIIEWNEDNFDISTCKFAKEAYDARKWAFVADYVRLAVLYEYGGIYLDTDMELFKSLDEYLANGILGFESRDYVGTAIIGSEPGNEIIKSFLNEYESSSFISENGQYNSLSNVHRIKSYLLSAGLLFNNKPQSIMGFSVYNQNVFYPNTLTMIFNKTPIGCASVHHAEGSWRDGSTRILLKHRLRRYLVGLARNILGTDFLEKLKG